MLIQELYTVEQQLLEAHLGPWTLLESHGPVQIMTSSIWDDSIRNLKAPEIGQKVQQFIQFKMANPIQQYGGSDTPMAKGAPMGLAIKGLRHAHLTRDVSLYYTIEGRDPILFKLYGLFTHRDSGTGTPANINKQRSLADKFSNAGFELPPSKSRR